MKERIEDLSARARRGELGETGLRQLALGLGSSVEARLLHNAGCEFDTANSVLSGDDVVAARVISRVLKSRDGTRRRRLRSYKLAFAAIAWTAATAAAAPLLVGSSVIQTSTPMRLDVPKSLSEASLRRTEAASSHRVSERKVLPEALRLSQPTISKTDLQSRPQDASAIRPSTARAQVQTARDLTTSGQVFAEANRLRREGRSTEAVTLYVTLRRSFPGSAEAHVADIALGMLRLQGGSPGIALEHFHRYQRLNPSGDLTPEALWGEAQSLDGLGRAEVARRAYSKLLHRYPESAYASAARVKLQLEP